MGAAWCRCGNLVDGRAATCPVCGAGLVRKPVVMMEREASMGKPSKGTRPDRRLKENKGLPPHPPKKG